MVRIGKIQLAAMVLLCFTLMAGQSQAELYKFSGVLPLANNPNNQFELETADTDMEGKVNPGDSWTVLLEVDLGTGAQTAPDGVGWYGGAIVNATLSFSSGYEFTFPLAPEILQRDVVVQNQPADWDGTPFVGLYGDIFLDDEAQTQLFVQVLTDTQLDAVDGIALPVAGKFKHNLSLSGNTDEVLSFGSPDGGWVSYWSMSGEVFQVVPEPSTITLWGIAALGLCGVWWRKRRAR